MNNSYHWVALFIFVWATPKIIAMSFCVGLAWNAPVYPTVRHWQYSQSNTVWNNILWTPTLFGDLLLWSVLFVPVQAHTFYLTLDHLTRTLFKVAKQSCPSPTVSVADTTALHVAIIMFLLKNIVLKKN